MKIGVFDVGGTFIKYAISDELGNLSCLGKLPTPLETKEDFIKCIHRILNQLGKVDGLAFSLPGFIDNDKGYISVGGSLRYHDSYKFIENMQKEFQLPISIENDARCAALAELWKGEAKHYKNAVMLVFGTGIGSALIQEGQIYRGSHHMANELSCIISRDLKEHGMNATLGSRFGIPSLAKRISKVVNQEIKGEDIFELIKQGNQAVIEIYKRYIYELSIEIFNFQCMYDPDVFYIGGGVSEQEMFIQSLQVGVHQFIDNLPFEIPHIELKKATFSSKANLVGAVYRYLLKQGTLS